MGLVYLINEEYTDNYKIGITRSKTETHRRKTLQTGNSKKLETIHTFKTDYPYRIESMLHFQYFNKRGNGEWFQLSEEDVANFLPLCEELSERLRMLMKYNYFFQQMDIK